RPRCSIAARRSATSSRCCLASEWLCLKGAPGSPLRLPMSDVLTAERPATPLTLLQWTICAIAAIGFLFDSYELLVLPLVARPALPDRLGAAATPRLINDWASLLFWVPAVAGGVFGLVGGYLTDLFGRRRVLVWSILLYALSALASGYSTSVWMLLVW